MRKWLPIFSLFVIISLVGCSQIKNSKIKKIKDNGEIEHVEINTEKYKLEISNPDGLTTIEQEYNYEVKLLHKIKFK